MAFMHVAKKVVAVGGKFLLLGVCTAFAGAAGKSLADDANQGYRGYGQWKLHRATRRANELRSEQAQNGEPLIKTAVG